MTSVDRLRKDQSLQETTLSISGATESPQSEIPLQPDDPLAGTPWEREEGPYEQARARLHELYKARPERRPERHPNSARFHELLEQAGHLHDLKQGDYGRENDPFANVRSSDEWGIDPWVGAMVRLNDKVKRLQRFASHGFLVNESAKDSFMDIAVYALIAYVLYEQQYEPQT